MRRHDAAHSRLTAGRRLLRSALAASAAALALLAVHPAQAVVFQDSTAQSAGLGSGQGFLDAEAKLVISLSSGSNVGCSGSLLSGGQYVLTAAHCVTGDSGTLSANNISLTFANTGVTTSTSSYIVDPGWNGSPGADLALVRLVTPITSISGYSLYTAAPAFGSVVTLVGYGTTGVGSTGYVQGTFGTLYYGANQYDGFYTDYPSVYAYDFDMYCTSSDPTCNASYNQTGGGAVGTNEAMIAPGDSGGASLLLVDGNWQIVGVHDFISCNTTNCTPNSTFGQLGGDTSVYADQAWLDATLGISEPDSAALLLIGLLGIGLLSRRGRRGHAAASLSAAEAGSAVE